MRKVRFAASGRGKRGGSRIISYFLDKTMPLYALLAYAKNAKTDTSHDEKKAVSALAHAVGNGAAIIHEPLDPREARPQRGSTPERFDPREVRLHAHLTQAQMAPLMGMILSGYQNGNRVSVVSAAQPPPFYES